MNKLVSGNVLFSAFVIGISAVLLWTTISFEADQVDVAFPQILLAFMCLLGIYVLMHELRSSSGEDPRVSPRLSLLPLLIAVLYPPVALVIGFYATTFFFLLLVPLIFLSDGATDSGGSSFLHRAGVGLIFATGVTVFLYASFTILLRFSLPEGLLI